MARRQAISPVIATVIIVAVTIAVAIAVAFWMTGIIGLFTGFEQVQIVSVIPVWDSNKGQWNITLVVKNTGTSAASPDILYINGVPVAGVGAVSDPGITVYYNSTTNKWTTGAQTLPPGSTAFISIIVKPGTYAGINFDHGVSLEIKLHTASGKEYPKLVVLP